MLKQKVPQPSTALVTARKGFLYRIVKQFGRNHGMTRIRAYKIDLEKKRLSLGRGQVRGGW